MKMDNTEYGISRVLPKKFHGTYAELFLLISHGYRHLRLTALVVILSLVSVTASAAGSVLYPKNGTTLTGSTQDFEFCGSSQYSWTCSVNSDEPAVTDWWVYAGSSVGAKDYADSGNLGADRFHQISGLPEDGSTVHVRLWYRPTATGPGWGYSDYTYTADTGSKPYFTQPTTVNQMLTGKATVFSWNDNGYGATSYQLMIFNEPYGAYDVASIDFRSGVTTSTSIIADGLPTRNSSPNSQASRYVVLRARHPVDGWQWVDDAIVQAYTRDEVPSIVLPTPDGTLPGSAATFNWTNSNVPVTNYWIYVGARHGGKEYHDSGNLGTNLSSVVSSLPTDASEVYVRLWYKSAGVWKYSDEQYKASGIGPEMITPVPGSMLVPYYINGQDDLQFNWTDNGAGVAQWWLYAGTYPGGIKWIDSLNLGATTSYSVVNSILGLEGGNVSVRLWHRPTSSSFWRHTDFNYTLWD